MKKNFTIQQMKTALLAVQGSITDAQMRMLQEHYSCGSASMEQLAKAGGYGENYRTGNLQYGVLCGRIAKELGFVSPGDQTYAVATVVDDKKDERGHCQWRMDEVVMRALEELGWVGRAA